MNDQRKTKKQLLEELERERERSIALQEVSNKVAAAHDTDEVLDLIVNEAARLVGAPAAYIRLLEGEFLVTRAATESMREMGSTTLVVGEGFMGHVMATKKPRVMENVEEEELLTPEIRKLVQATGFVSAAAVPLLANNISVGVLAVGETNIRRFTEDEVSLLTAFADQASLALEKARLLNEAETERERAETERERADARYRVSNLLAGAHDTDEVLNLIVNEAARLVGAKAGFIRLVVDGVGVPTAATASAAGYLAESNPAVTVQEDKTAAGHVMATMKPIAIDNMFKSEWIPPALQQKAEKHGFQAIAIVPLVVNSQPIGLLAVFDGSVRHFTDDEVSLLSAFADQAALALQKARLLKDAETERERADSLYRVSNLLAGAHDTDEVLDLIVNEATRLLGASAAYMRLLHGDTLVASVTTRSAAGFLEETGHFGGLIVGEGRNVAGHVMATKKPLVLEDSQETSRVSDRARPIWKKYGFHGFVVVPLVANDRSLGILSVIDKRVRRFTDDEVSLLTAFADQAALALEKARLLSEAERRTAELAATNQELEAFSYSVSHDLRAPLRGIDGFSQALMNEYSDVLDEQAQHYLERVRTGSERMGQLIDDLLALSQVTRGEMRREEVDLSDLARTIVTGLQERDPQRQVEFIIQDGVVLNGDTRLLRVALENLLGNAWKYTGKKQKARIEFGRTEDDGKRTCFVRDDGSGFDMAYADRLFGAFQRLHDASEFEGSGIGLATVQRIINRHGGRIWAESAVGEGATFYFTLA